MSSARWPRAYDDVLPRPTIMTSDPQVNLSKGSGGPHRIPPPPPPPPPPRGALPPPPPPGQSGPYVPNLSSRNGGRVAVALLGAMLVLGGLAWGVWTLTSDDSAEDAAMAQMTPATQSVQESAPTAQRLSPATAAATVTLPPGTTTCPAVYGPVGVYRSSAAGTTITSCPFAEEVRIAYAAGGVAGLSRRVSAFSPITKRFYDMECSAGQFVTCRGGNDAVVYVY